MATGSAGGLAALPGRPAGTTPLHDFNRENLPQGQDALTTKQGAEPSCAFGAALLQGLADGAEPDQAGRLDVAESDDRQLVRHSHPEPVGGREHADGLGI
jgi:hypothetical protein